MKVTSIEHIGTDQNQQDETTIVWFDIDAEDDFYSGNYGVAFKNHNDPVLLDADGCPQHSGTSSVKDAIFNKLIDWAREQLAQI